MASFPVPEDGRNAQFPRRSVFLVFRISEQPPDFLGISGSGTGATEPHEDN
jgi:hypothetical protein